MESYFYTTARYLRSTAFAVTMEPVSLTEGPEVTGRSVNVLLVTMASSVRRKGRRQVALTFISLFKLNTLIIVIITIELLFIILLLLLLYLLPLLLLFSFLFLLQA